VLREQITFPTQIVGLWPVPIRCFLANPHLQQPACVQNLEIPTRVGGRRPELRSHVPGGPKPVRAAQHHQEFDLIDRINATMKEGAQFGRELCVGFVRHLRATGGGKIGPARWARDGARTG
jgi:hypothetical protein